MADIDWAKAEAEVKEKGEVLDEMLGAWNSANPTMLVDFSVLNYPPRISLSVAAEATHGNRLEAFDDYALPFPVRAKTMSVAEMELAGELAADIATILHLRVFREPETHGLCRYTFKPIYLEVKE